MNYHQMSKLMKMVILQSRQIIVVEHHPSFQNAIIVLISSILQQVVVVSLLLQHHLHLHVHHRRQRLLLLSSRNKFFLHFRFAFLKWVFPFLPRNCLVFCIIIIKRITTRTITVMLYCILKVSSKFLKLLFKKKRINFERNKLFRWEEFKYQRGMQRLNHLLE